MCAARESGAVAGQTARQLAEAREQLGAARALAAERSAARDQLAARLRQADEAAAGMRDEVARLLRQVEAQEARVRQSVARHEDEARAAAAEGARLRSEAEALQGELRRAYNQLADANTTIDQMKLREATHIEEIQNLENIINNKNQHEREMEAEINSIKDCVRQLEMNKVEAQEQLSKSAQECGALRSALDELTRAADELRAGLAREQQQHRATRDADAARLAELGAAAAARARELDASTGTIARLMTDLRAESDARSRADAALAAARREHDADRDALKAKDDELAAQMTIILDMRGEKERLQERIQGMQNTIDNIQKELTGRLAAPKCADASEPPELDGGPRPGELYSFLSDGSVDGDALDVSAHLWAWRGGRRVVTSLVLQPHEVGRRFAALSRGGMRRVRDVRDVRAERLHAAQVCMNAHCTARKSTSVPCARF
ncbi:hypothetical protein PYW08_002960 [Mythimna loreyi]|uniref:Uncharacterized protein n=1 Tax=Mythimna loreyi TaxID=667449 RepID=A0ACC2QQE0_9NEOP|nr:hypothetical protein PYW08_002960 [Mythimna loreyi]